MEVLGMVEQNTSVLMIALYTISVESKCFVSYVHMVEMFRILREIHTQRADTR